MRLKQLLGIGLALPLLSALAAADSQLTDINVQAKGNTATVTIHANGALNHNDYRPADNLLLVDFPGASVGTLDASAHTVSAPGVISYQVHSYKSANGTDIARLELTLAAHANVRFDSDKNALLVTVSTDPQNASSAASPANETVAASRAPVVAPHVAKPTPIHNPTAEIVQVRGITVVRGHEGTNIEIRSSGLLTPQVLTLKSPDRLVIDLPNAIAESRSHDIPVHAADLNMVRMGRFRADPPVTRVVLDLKAPQDFQLASTTDKLIVKLRPLTAGVTTSSSKAEPATAPKTVAKSTQPTELPATASAKTAAQNFVFLEPNYRQVATPKDVIEEHMASERAASAAKVLGATPPVEIPLTSGPSEAAMKPEAMKAAMMQAAQGGSSAQAMNAVSSTANCNTGRYTGEPISVNLKDVDLKDFFRLIHEISGLNVVLDPGVTGNLTIVLDDVPWDQALAIVLQNNSLQCQLSGNVLRIALPDTLRKEADALRATEEAQALAVDRVTVTRYLSYATAKNIVPTLKQFISRRGNILADDRTNSLIVQDIPSTIPGLDRLITELDKKTKQVEIEARVIAATRSFARDLGAQFAFGFAPGSTTAVGGSAAVGVSPITNTYFSPPGYFTIPGIPSNSTGGTAASIPLFSNFPATGPTSGLTLQNITSNYRLDLILSAAESRGLLKILSRPRIVTQNNAQALVRQGVQIPVVTAAQLGGPPTVSYVAAFLRLQVTPQITSENTVFLNVDVENTTPNFGVSVNNNPELITQQATTQVLVADGGTVVIGGVIQTNDSVTMQQVPVLGNVPILGNLFKHRFVQTSTQELIFFITPRIIQS